MTEEGNKDYYSTGEIAEIVNVSPSTVYRWCEDEKIKAYKVGTWWRVKKVDFDEYLKRGREVQK
jgi:excisionase family DNA binding protein